MGIGCEQANHNEAYYNIHLTQTCFGVVCFFFVSRGMESKMLDTCSRENVGNQKFST